MIEGGLYKCKLWLLHQPARATSNPILCTYSYVLLRNESCALIADIWYLLTQMCLTAVFSSVFAARGVPFTWEMTCTARNSSGVRQTKLGLNSISAEGNGKVVGNVLLGVSYMNVAMCKYLENIINIAVGTYLLKDINLSMGVDLLQKRLWQDINCTKLGAEQSCTAIRLSAYGYRYQLTSSLPL